MNHFKQTKNAYTNDNSRITGNNSDTCNFLNGTGKMKITDNCGNVFLVKVARNRKISSVDYYEMTCIESDTPKQVGRVFKQPLDSFFIKYSLK